MILLLTAINAMFCHEYGILYAAIIIIFLVTNFLVGMAKISMGELCFLKIRI